MAQDIPGMMHNLTSDVQRGRGQSIVMGIYAHF